MRRTAVTYATASVEVEAGATVIDTARSPGVIAEADVVPQHLEIHAAHSTTKLTSWVKDFSKTGPTLKVGQQSYNGAHPHAANQEPALSRTDPHLPRPGPRGGKLLGRRAHSAAAVGYQYRRHRAGRALSRAKVRRCVSRLQGAGAAVALMAMYRNVEGLDDLYRELVPSCSSGKAESAERDSGRLHKLEARKPYCLLVKRQCARTPYPRSKLCDQRVRK
jgi:hypothetical protein